MDAALVLDLQTTIGRPSSSLRFVHPLRVTRLPLLRCAGADKMVVHRRSLAHVCKEVFKLRPTTTDVLASNNPFPRSICRSAMHAMGRRLIDQLLPIATETLFRVAAAQVRSVIVRFVATLALALPHRRRTAVPRERDDCESSVCVPDQVDSNSGRDFLCRPILPGDKLTGGLLRRFLGSHVSSLQRGFVSGDVHSIDGQSNLHRRSGPGAGLRSRTNRSVINTSIQATTSRLL